MAQERPEGIPGFPRSGTLDLSDRANDGRRRRAKADIAKPLHGMGSGVLEIALAFKGDAFRVVYAVQLGDDIWVVHAFQKKSTKGIKTPRHEIDLVKDRLRTLKEMLR